jgi:hypothetical protein
MFWRKKDDAFEELCAAYQEKIAAQDAKIAALERRPYYVTIPVPQTDEQRAQYMRAVAQFDTNEHLAYHIVDLWEKATQEFLMCRDSSKSEFFRGKLDAYNGLILDGRKCRKAVEG